MSAENVTNNNSKMWQVLVTNWLRHIIVVRTTKVVVGLIYQLEAKLTFSRTQKYFSGCEIIILSLLTSRFQYSKTPTLLTYVQTCEKSFT